MRQSAFLIVVASLVLSGCQKGSEASNTPDLNAMPANVEKTFAEQYVGKYWMVPSDEEEARAMKEAGITNSSLDVRPDGTFLWMDMEEKKEGTWRSFEGELTLELKSADGVPPANQPEVPMSLSRLDDKSDRVLLHDTYRKIDFTFEREGVQKEPETPTNAPDSNSAANVAVPQNH